MTDGATRTRTVLFVGSSQTYYNGGIDAIVLSLVGPECGLCW